MQFDMYTSDYEDAHLVIVHESLDWTVLHPSFCKLRDCPVDFELDNIGLDLIFNSRKEERSGLFLAWVHHYQQYDWYSGSTEYDADIEIIELKEAEKCQEEKLT